MAQTRVWVEPHTDGYGTYHPGYWMLVYPHDPYGPSIIPTRTGPVPVAGYGTEILQKGLQQQYEQRQQQLADPNYQRMIAEQRQQRAEAAAERKARWAKNNEQKAAAKQAKKYERLMLKNMTPEQIKAEDTSKARQEAQGQRTDLEDIGWRLKMKLKVSGDEFRRWKMAQPKTPIPE